jgi:hypothetical protein
VWYLCPPAAQVELPRNDIAARQSQRGWANQWHAVSYKQPSKGQSDK